MAQQGKSIGTRFIHFFGGVFVGALSWLPFFAPKHFARTIRIPDSSAEDALPFEKGFPQLLKKRWSYLLGLILGAFFFFLIPVTYLNGLYYTSFEAMMLVFTIVFGIFEAVMLVKHFDKKHILGEILTFALTFFFLILIHTFSFATVTVFHAMSAYAVILLLMAVGTFAATFAGQALGSVFFIGSIYLNFSDVLAKVTRLQSLSTYFFLVFFMALGAFIGFFLATFLQSGGKNLRNEKHAMNFAFYLVGAVFVGLTLKAPFFPEAAYPTDTANIIVLVSVIFTAFIISMVCLGYQFPFFNKDDKEENMPVPFPVASAPAITPKPVIPSSVSAAQKETLAKALASKKSTEAAASKPAEKPSAPAPKPSAGVDIAKLKELEKKLKK
jgi:hypothetical protein